MRFKHVLTFAFVAIFLSACQTLSGAKKDINGFFESFSQKPAPAEIIETTDAPIADGSCPNIIIDPQLDTIAEFTDMEKPDPAEEISRAALTRAKSECNLTDEVLEMRVDLTFESMLGPKARRRDIDRPFFAYPYFISVTDDTGTELAREVFAASITFEYGQDTMSLVETIRQKLPLNEDGSLPPYQVNIGFQLTEDQLFYNASSIN